jgi:hypothetical protein
MSPLLFLSPGSVRFSRFPFWLQSHSVYTPFLPPLYSHETPCQVVWKQKNATRQEKR